MTRRQKGITAARAMRGVTLVELIMFIAIVAVVAIAMVQAFSATARGSHTGKELTQATEIAQQRMEVILGQRKRFGYTGLTALNYDPCLAPVAPWNVSQACATTAYPAGNFFVTSTFSSVADACGAGTGTNCRLITVTVASPGGNITGICTGSNIVTCLTYQTWNY